MVADSYSAVPVAALAMLRDAALPTTHVPRAVPVARPTTLHVEHVEPVAPPKMRVEHVGQRLARGRLVVIL